MAEIKLTANEMMQKRLTYFRVIYLIGLISFSIFVVKFNVELNASHLNPILLPTLLIYLIAPPLTLKLFGNYILSAAILGGTSAFLAIYMIYVSGGNDAPGIVWLAAVPLYLGFLLGLPGVYAGYTIVTGTLIFFSNLKSKNIGPLVFMDQATIERERMLNLILFLLFSSVTTHLFIRSEEKFMKRLVEQNSYIDNLLRTVIHDISNSLTTMTYNLLKAKGYSENVHTTEFEKMEKAVNDIGQFLNQVRTLKSFKDGKSSFSLAPVSIQQMLSEVLEITRELADQKSVQVTLDISTEQMLIKGEKTILSNMVFMNLINNAIKFSYPGDNIQVKAYCLNSKAIIEIQDNGIGIPQEILKHVFDIHSKTSRPGTNGEKGTGYGLPLVKEYLELMGGKIEIFSEENQSEFRTRGTRVMVHFPLLK